MSTRRCPSCGRYVEVVRVRKGGIQRIQANRWRRRSNHSIRVYWPTVVLRDLYGIKPHRCEPEEPRVGRYYRPQFSSDPVDPDTLPVITDRPPKDRKNEFEERAKAKRKRHRQAQSKQRR